MSMPNAFASSSSSSSSSNSDSSYSSFGSPSRPSTLERSSIPKLRSRPYLSSTSSRTSSTSRRLQSRTDPEAWTASLSSKWKGKEREVPLGSALDLSNDDRAYGTAPPPLGQEVGNETNRRNVRPPPQSRARLAARQFPLPADAQGPGGQGGVVLPLQMIGSGLFEVSYNLPITVGREDTPQTFLLQVDSGSSDLWIASTSCTADSCSRSGSRFYDPSASGAVATGVRFDIDYLRGHVEGPVFWDRVVVGGYGVENQALSAADQVIDEPLSPTFNGILGLALPLNSVIAQRLPAGVTNDPDGAAWASNLFSITPTINAPAARFISMLLSRPGSDRVPAVMGIGRHPTQEEGGVLSEDDVQRVQYSTLVSERLGTLFWKTSLREIVVWVDGTAHPIELPRGGTGSVFPTAILDSGVPLIFTTSTIANAIYGAIGVSPSKDGEYFVPCNQPLNITVRLDDRDAVSLHPLDLTADPPDDNRATFCVGLIQAADGALGSRESLADVVLGVPFLRNVYSVMAFTQPNADGSFPNMSPPEPSPTLDEDGNPIPTSSDALPTPTLSNQITPRLGILGITDPVVAIDEFNTVRILNRPISNGTTTPSNNDNTTRKEGGLATGVIVGIALVSFAGVCAVLWVVRWYLHRRRDRALLASMGAAYAGGAAARKKRGRSGKGDDDDDAWGDGGKEREMVLGSLYGTSRTKGVLGGDGYALTAVKSHLSSSSSEKPPKKVLGEENQSSSTLVGYGVGKKGEGSPTRAPGSDVDAERVRTVSEASTADTGKTFASQQKASSPLGGLAGEEVDPWDPTTSVPWGAAAGGAAAGATSSAHSRQGLANSLGRGRDQDHSRQPRVDSATLPPSSPEQSINTRLLDEDDHSPERLRSPVARATPVPASSAHHRHQSSTVTPLLLNDWQDSDGEGGGGGGGGPASAAPLLATSPPTPAEDDVLLVSASPPTSAASPVSSSLSTTAAILQPPPPTLTPLTPQTTASIVSPISPATRRNPSKGILRVRERKHSGGSSSPIGTAIPRPAKAPSPPAQRESVVGTSEDLWGAPSPPPVQPIKKLAMEDQKRQMHQQRRKSLGRSRSGSGSGRSKSLLSREVVLEEEGEGEGVPAVPSGRQ